MTAVIIDGNSKARIKEELENTGLNIDWAFYRREQDVDRLIKTLNEDIIKDLII